MCWPIAHRSVGISLDGVTQAADQVQVCLIGEDDAVGNCCSERRLKRDLLLRAGKKISDAAAVPMGRAQLTEVRRLYCRFVGVGRLLLRCELRVEVQRIDVFLGLIGQPALQGETLLSIGTGKARA